MKQRIKIVFGAVVLALALVAPQGGNAQSHPPPPVPAVPDNAVAPMTLPANLVPDSPLGQIIQLLQSGASVNMVLARINNSGIPLNISAAGLVYLNDLGTPSEIVTALSRHDQKLGVRPVVSGTQPTPAAQAREPQEITEDYFYGALAPYGTWTNLPGYGLCWQPCAVQYDANWMPYGTLGQWIYTDCGWYWLSGYTWGWCAFHYGRWFHDAHTGWLWWPDTAWAPSWVFWRYGNGYSGWAPLPPHSDYSQQIGLEYNGAAVASDCNFGIGAGLFNFVPMSGLFNANLEHIRLGAAQAAQVFARSKVLSDINSNDRTIVNDGIPVFQVAKYTGGAMRSYTIRPAKSVPVPGATGEQILPDGRTVAIDRPYLNGNGPSDLSQGIRPVPSQEQPVAHQRPIIIVNENPLSYTPANNQNNNVIYMDSAAQNGPPVPTVTTAGPQDANAPAGSGPAQSYWAGWAGASAPGYAPEAYMSPRLASHERSERKVDQPANHRDFHPPTQGSRPIQNPGGSHAPPRQTGTPSQSHSPAPAAPAHAAPSGGGDSHDHGH